MTDLAHLIVAATLKPGDLAVDATVGNGHDTAFLADRVGVRGRVFGFDVQAQAIVAAQARLSSDLSVTLYEIGHERMRDVVPPEARGQIGAVMFNLGYLPGGDKSIVTAAATTLTALDAALGLLRVGGLVTIVLYPAHQGGSGEADAVRTFAEALASNFSATRHTRLAADRPIPELLVIERLR